ncbi:MAG: hypothetical protein FJ278_23970, partial [Planctomycetes bacterium]|nr:hypothetical protein [Planctomycetota bacterium]
MAGDEERKAELVCPRCEVRMDRVPLKAASEEGGDIVIERCPKCRGMWFDEFELDRVITAKPKELLESDKAGGAGELEDRKMKCPQCGGSMIKVKSLQNRNVTVDSCPVCYGNWLDSGR